MEERTCPTCKEKFVISKWQKSKIYCSGPCSQGSYRYTNAKQRKAKK